MLNEKPLSGLAIVIMHFPRWRNFIVILGTLGASALITVLSAGLCALFGWDSTKGLRGGDPCFCFFVTPYQGRLNCGSAINPRIASQAGVILTSFGVQLPAAAIQTIYIVLIVHLLQSFLQFAHTCADFLTLCYSSFQGSQINTNHLLMIA